MSGVCERPSRRRAWVLLAVWLVFGGAFAGTLRAEAEAFNAAARLFDDRFYAESEKAFEAFLAAHPESERKGDVILFQARSRFLRGDHSGTIQLLEKHLPEAGALGDRYQFLLAESYFEQNEFLRAAHAYAELIKLYPDSTRRLDAFYNKALAYSRLGNWNRVIEILREPGGGFETAAATLPNNPFVIRGQILLAEACLTLERLDEGLAALAQLEDRTPGPESNWRRLYLLTRLQLAKSQPEAAFETSTNLLALAEGTGQRQFHAEAVWLQGEIFQALGRPAAAIEAYEKNLTADAPAPLRRGALLKVIELHLSENRARQAAERLETFIKGNPSDDTVDLARLTLGEMRLREFIEQAAAAGVAAGSTNLLPAALAEFDAVIAGFPNSDLIGKAHLNRGWCLWLLGRIADARSAFEQAARALPVSEEQAVARFKLGDTLLSEGDFTSAIENYRQVIDGYAGVPRVKEALLDQALYQMLRAAIEADERETAERALGRIIEEFPNSLFGDRSVLLVGQYLNGKGVPADARECFSGFAARFPGSQLTAVAEIALARTFAQERDWEGAIQHYDLWVDRFAGHELLPQAEFSRALAYQKVGREADAFPIMTNLQARFPAHPLVPLVYNWKADYYFNREDFPNALRNYQLLFQHPGVSPELAYQGRLMAGRAAMAAHLFKDARDHFSQVLPPRDTNAPPRIAAQALFALGDASFAQFLENTNSITELREALTAFGQVTDSLPAQAWGRIGDCHFHYANLLMERKTAEESARAASSYEDAARAYRNSLAAANADPVSRGAAQVGLALIHQKLGQTNQALERYLTVAYELEGQKFDAHWIRIAGLAAGELCEAQGRWDEAGRLYRRIGALFPALQPALERRIRGFPQQPATARN